MMQPVEQKTTARLTGVFYLMLAISGALGFILIRPMLYAPHDAAQTAKNLVEHASLARLGVALELAIVLSQALAALWFFRLFRSVDWFCAGATAAFGLVNAIAIMISAACLTTASDVVAEAAPVVGDAAARSALLLFHLSGAC